MGVPAKGKQTTVKGVSILTFTNGKIASQHDYWDANTVLQQLKG
jgi:predicted ester cyclase